MEDARRTILDFISRNDCNSIFREFVGKSGATLGIFEGRNSGCHLTNSQYRRRFADRGYIAYAHSPGLSIWGCVSCNGCPNLSSAAEIEAYVRREGEGSRGFAERSASGRWQALKLEGEARGR